LDDKELDPRTAVGMDKNGRRLILIVVDGRQPFYSMGATFSELADLLIGYGVYEGMSLDGGGSATMVIERGPDEWVILNSPIDNYIPGRERPVANHLGIYLK
jgi:exopolysaccharide biosynthesis protein